MKNLYSALLLTLSLAACGKGSGDKAASVDLFGKRPVPPGDLAKVKAGMTQAQVKALFPKATPPANHSGSPALTIPSGYSDARFEIIFYSDKDAVADVDVEVPKDVAAKLESAWGAPSEKTMWPKWFNDEDGYEASIMEMGRKTRVSFRPYLPLNGDFFGKAPGPVGALAKLKLGMSREEVAKTVPGLEGPPKGGGSFVPYDAGPRDSTMQVGYSYDTDKLERMELDMPKAGLAAMEKAWGPGKKVAETPNASAMECWDTAHRGERWWRSQPRHRDVHAARAVVLQGLKATRAACRYQMSQNTEQKEKLPGSIKWFPSRSVILS